MKSGKSFFNVGRLVLFVLVLMVAVVGCSSPSNETARINQMLDQYEAAVGQADVEAWQALLTDPVRVQNVGVRRDIVSDYLGIPWRVFQSTRFELRSRDITLNKDATLATVEAVMEYEYSLLGLGLGSRYGSKTVRFEVERIGANWRLKDVVIFPINL